MAIPNKNPLTVPASEEKQFNSLWISELRIYAPTTTTGGVSLTLTPFNEKTGEIAPPEMIETIVISDLWALIAEVPEVAAAMGAVFAAVPAIQDYNEPQEDTP
jgi:hypothetical protein